MMMMMLMMMMATMMMMLMMMMTWRRLRALGSPRESQAQQYYVPVRFSNTMLFLFAFERDPCDPGRDPS